MLLRTHLSAGILAGLMLEPAGLAGYERLVYYLIIIIATVLPDIDHQNSRIGREYPLISSSINMIFGHRGLFHAFLLPAGLWWIVSQFADPAYGAAILIGMLSHLILDCMTVQGVALLEPLTSFRVQGFVTTGGLLESGIFMMLIIAIVIWIF